MPERITLTPATREAAIEAAARTLRGGGVALLPAEGVYGLHARADLPAAMARLRALKPRAAGRGTIVLIAAPADLDAWAASPDPVARSLADAHWPGALTIVVPASPRAPEAVLGPEGTIALRCPGPDLLRAIVARAGGLVASTSANAPDEPPAVTADHPVAAGTDFILDAGPLAGIPSTVIAVREGAVRILREGAVRLGADA